MSFSNQQHVNLGSQHTTSFTEILSQLNIALVVSTYQAGKLILIRANQGCINTHFKNFSRPMGIAVCQNRLAIGTRDQILTYRNVPNVKIQGVSEPTGEPYYLPAHSHVTSNVDIHEMAFAGNDLWFVNTQFSCLCTLDSENSFVPRWRPPFVSAFALGDRCHLNGLAVRDQQVRYVTALGQTDTTGGWRANKANGGLLIDLQDNQILIEGLSMPHSPRWYRDQLWILESGYGSLSLIDITNQSTQMVTRMPGFTRGCAFYGDFAFVGLSKVRESASFSGLPLTQSLEERICGIWVIHLRTGNIAAFLKFQGDVEEIFAVEVLPNCQYPEIAEWDEGVKVSAFILPDEVLAETVRDPLMPSKARLEFERGNLSYQNGQLQDAIAAYQICLELDPSYLQARFNLGVAMGDIGNYETALYELQQIIQADAAHAEAHNSLAFVYVKLNDLTRAAAHYQKAIQIRPNYQQARENLAQVTQLLKANGAEV